MSDPDQAEKQRKERVAIEDEMIAYFCELHGGLEFAMPMIQTQIKRVGIDFNNPSKAQLLELAKNLTEITTTLQSKEKAKKEYNHFMRILRNIS